LQRYKNTTIIGKKTAFLLILVAVLSPKGNTFATENKVLKFSISNWDFCELTFFLTYKNNN